MSKLLTVATDTSRLRGPHRLFGPRGNENDFPRDVHGT